MSISYDKMLLRWTIHNTHDLSMMYACPVYLDPCLAGDKSLRIAFPNWKNSANYIRTVCMVRGGSEGYGTVRIF